MDKTTDQVFLERYVVSGRHGVLPEEKIHAQPFAVSVMGTLDMRSAAQSDKLADTVNYVVFAKIIEETVTKESFDLIERLATTIVERIFAATAVTSLTIEIRKEQILAPASVGIRMTRSREEFIA